jgi:hypothetical protein
MICCGLCFLHRYVPLSFRVILSHDTACQPHANRGGSYTNRLREVPKLFLHKEAPEHQRIHARAEKSTHCVRRSVHDGFAAEIE